MTSQPQNYGVATLARSILGLMLLIFLPSVIAWIFYLLSPTSPDAGFAQMQMLIIIGWGTLNLVLLLAVVWAARAPMTQIHRIVAIIANILGRWWLSLVMVIVLLEANLIGAIAFDNIAPFLMGPARFLLFCWSLVFLLIVAILHKERLESWWQSTRNSWAITGVAFIIGGLVLVLYLLSARINIVTGFEDKLRGQLDYRALSFWEDGQTPPSPQQFWAEQSLTRVQWLPYSYWVVEPFNGEYIHIDSNGLRYTPSYVPDGADALKIGIFGGSTVWGEGARDAYTIAGHIARLLAENGTPQQVINYGQTGYVSTQDMILFQMQLAQGQAPDIAVFYQGFNDVLSAYRQERAGLAYQEVNRIVDVEAGRLLRQGQPVLIPPAASLDAYDWSLITTAGADAESIAERYFANLQMIEAVAEAFDVEVIFVWQPSLYSKTSLTPVEAGIIEELDNNMPGFIELFQQVDALVRERVAEAELDNVLIISDLFAEDERQIFYDLIHITEVGNYEVAQAILPMLLSHISKD